VGQNGKFTAISKDVQLGETMLQTTTLALTTTYQKLSTLLAAAGISEAVFNEPGYIRNLDTGINVFVASGYEEIPSGNKGLVTPQAAISFLAEFNANECWVKSASGTPSIDFAVGSGGYENPRIDGVVGTITLGDGVIPKGDSGNLVASSIEDDGTAITLGEDVIAEGSVLSPDPTGGIGYSTGAGGAVTQATNKATTVESDTITTAITMNNAQLNANTAVSFTFTNSAIASTDQVIVTHQSAGTAGSYNFAAFPGAGSAVVTVRNITAGNLSEAIVLRVSVYKAVSA
jgi:hypothetical protein